MFVNNSLDNFNKIDIIRNNAVKFVAIFQKRVVVDCSERLIAFRGAGGEPCLSLTCPTAPA
jgi:hypothetical protein